MVESVRRVVKISKVIIKAKLDIMLQGTRKRHLPTSEFSGKFDCKQDFMKYFKEQCKDLTNLTNGRAVQLYLPSDIMVNKDFLKQVLAEEKELLPIKDVRFVNVPMYDELAVKRLWPEM
jgi:hypothetical protein